MNLIVTSRAKKDLAQLDSKTLRRVQDALNKLLTDPETVDLKKLQGEIDKWRLRVGNHRAIMRISPKEQTIYILRVRHRREAY